MQFIKKKLKDHLSVSAKISLRRLLSHALGTVAFVARLPERSLKRVAAVAKGRGVPFPRRFTNNYSFEVPEILGRIDEVELAKLLSEGREQLSARGEMKSSIVIPVFNKAAFTQRCLQSVLKEIDLRSTEVIVVNNASTDSTANVLRGFGDLILVITNEENLGFVDACNQGAASARGEFLVFLNNDTEVLPGWLKHLEEAADQNPAAGGVGSMFLYPDGSIQEAGAIVWKDGEAHHYGWSASPDDRRFNFAREVDYCSAASLLIRKKLFQQLGGLDRRFAPAYYEDVDLCFGVRALGYKIIYQPASRLIHYEGATAGRDVKKGIKHFQITNREKFVEKWRTVLKRDHLEKDLKQEVAAAHRLLGPTVLVFDERVPSPDRDAGSARMFMILKALSQWSRVVFMAFNRTAEARYEAALWKEGIQTADTIDYRGLLKSDQVRAAVVSRPLLAEALIPRIRRSNAKVAIVFDMVDAHFIRLGREAAVSGDPKMANEAKRYKELEVRLARSSDLVWCNSPEDKHAMQKELPGKRIEVIPTIHELHERGRPFAEREHLLFVGNLAHRPNHDGVLYFLKEVFPALEKELPQAGLYIVGDNATPEILTYASEKIHVSGHVADIAPLFAACRVFIAPVRFGAGLKGKVGESMAYGLPVVTTSIGAEGFGLTNELNVMIADTPGEFTGAVVRLYSDKELWETVAANSYEHVRQNFTPAVIATVINRSIKETALTRNTQ